MKEKVSVTGVPETMIQTLYARAKESQKDNPMIQDDTVSYTHLTLPTNSLV